VVQSVKVPLSLAKMRERFEAIEPDRKRSAAVCSMARAARRNFVSHTEDPSGRAPADLPACTMLGSAGEMVCADPRQ